MVELGVFAPKWGLRDFCGGEKNLSVGGRPVSGLGAPEVSTLPHGLSTAVQLRAACPRSRRVFASWHGWQSTWQLPSVSSPPLASATMWSSWKPSGNLVSSPHPAQYGSRDQTRSRRAWRRRPVMRCWLRVVAGCRRLGAAASLDGTVCRRAIRLPPRHGAGRAPPAARAGSTARAWPGQASCRSVPATSAFAIALSCSLSTFHLAVDA